MGGGSGMRQQQIVPLPTPALRLLPFWLMTWLFDLSFFPHPHPHPHSTAGLVSRAQPKGGREQNPYDGE